MRLARKSGRFGWLLGIGFLLAVSHGATEAAADPPFVPWSALLPGFTTGYEPSSANDCTAGRLHCVDAVIREMQDRFLPLEAACNHNLMFSLTYLRTTEEYRRSVVMPGFFSDPTFVNHEDAVFARYYFDAWDSYRAGQVASTPVAWRLAFDAADRRAVSGLGNILLGISAHVNRDLPYVLAEIGLVKPDGSSRKPDHDKVNVFLNRVTGPLLQETASRYDPSADDTQIQGTLVDETAFLQLMVSWRELAWRNAELLVSAPTPAARALVEAEIERVSAIEAQLLIVATSYSPANAQQALGQLTSLLADPARVLQAVLDRNANLLRGILGTLFTPGATIRDNYCASHG